MTSDFLSKDGFLEYNNEAWAAVKEEPEVAQKIRSRGEFQARRAGSILDIASDRYYNTERCRRDFADCAKMVDKNSGGRLKALIFTDCSPIHRNKGI
jgi:hypothetical protein